MPNNILSLLWHWFIVPGMDDKVVECIGLELAMSITLKVALIRECGSVLYLGMPREISKLPQHISRVMPK